MIGVYGANGFIGRHLIRRLAARSRFVSAVSRRFDQDFVHSYSKKISFVEADLRQSLAISSTLQSVQTVIQLISSSSPALRNDHVVSDILDNVIPHVEFLRSCANSGIKKIIFLSSGGTVYGPSSSIPISETAPTNPISSHGLTKLTIEKYIQMYGHTEDISYVILRVSNPYGPGQQFRKGQGLIPAVLDRHHRGLPIKIFGDGSAKRDYIYVEDVIDAIELALSIEARAILNVGSGVPKTIVDVLDAIEAVSGFKFNREFVPQRSTDVDINALDCREAKRVLGWVPKTPFDDGIRRTVTAFRESLDS